ncbi:MAG: hypothetical protein IH591_05700 [Bacteroidales bacterium]|nr:hypothetical protein [Bacteroidales bacterium]
MNKRNGFLILALLLLLAASLYFFTRTSNAGGYGDPYRSVPEDACLILESPDLPGFLNKLSGRSGLFREMSSVKELNRFYSSFTFLDTLLAKKEIKKVFGLGNSVVSFHVMGKNRIVPLLSINVTPEMRQRHVREILGHTGAVQINESDYEGVNIFEIFSEEGMTNADVFVGFRQGSILCSSSRVLIENAVRNFDEGNDIRDDISFDRVFQAAGKNEDRIFIIFRNLPKLLSSFTAGRGTPLATSAGKLAGAAEGDVLIRENGLIVSGYIESEDASQSLYRFREIPAISFDSYKILPVATALFETSAMAAFRNTRQVSGTGQEVLPLIASQILPFTGDEVTRALIDIRERPVSDNMVLVYEIRNRDHIDKAIGSILRENVSDGEEHIIWFTPDDQTKLAVYKATSPGLHDLLVPGFAPGFNDLYYAIYDNFLITGSSYVTVTKVIYDNILNRTLFNDLAYRDFGSTLPSRASYLFYAVPARITGFLTDYITAAGSKAIGNNLESVRKLSAVGYQFAPSNEMLYHSLSVRFIEEVKEESTSEWETLLDTTACIKPFFFTNHNTGAREIFVQDLKNNVYLINAAGRVLWKAPVRERITGPVYMIDYLRNGKFQLVFAGREFIHMLDRNGNYVERFPVKLRSPAAGPLALFDYDNNRDYRLFVAGEDRMIYAYDKTGSVVKGWVPYKTQGLVRSEIKFFRVSGKDYIVAGDETGLYFLDRRGSVRFTTREPVRKAVNSEIRMISGTESGLVCSSPDGEIQIISFSGSVRKMSFQKFSSDHSFEYFDIDGDGTGEFLFIDKGKLYLYDHKGTRLFARDFNTNDLSGPIGFIFSGNDRGVGVVDNKSKLIYIVDRDGELFSGFPLRGASLFSIGRMTSATGFNLIVGGTDNFLYNYRMSR